MSRGPMVMRAGTRPDELHEPGLADRSASELGPAVGGPPGEHAPGSGPVEDVDVILARAVQIVARVISRRARGALGVCRVQAEDLVNESLAILLSEHRPSTFWDALRPEASGSEGATEARRVIVRAVGSSFWRLRDLRKREIARSSPDGDGQGKGPRKRMLIPRHQGLPENVALIDPSAFDAEQVDRSIDVWDAVRDLNPQQRRVLLARVVDRGTWADIGREFPFSNKQLRITVQQAKTALSRALRSYEENEGRGPRPLGGRP